MQTPAKATEVERYLFELINGEREARGLVPFRFDQTLNAAADAHSNWMLANNTLSHTGVGGSTWTERISDAGFDLTGAWTTRENLAAQQEDGGAGLFADVENVHATLMASPVHRVNILADDVDLIGIGIQLGNMSYGDLSAYSLVVTQKFASTEGVITPDIPSAEMAVQISGTAAPEHLIGTNQNDTINGSGGNDLLSGGDGEDTAVFVGTSSQYSITVTDASVTITDRVENEGTDTLNSIENLLFLDRSFELSLFTNVSSLTDVDLAALTELYVAYFNRAPDSVGLFYWGSRLADGMSMDQIARYFFDQDETRALYGTNLDTGAFITAVYGNVLGRSPDPEGFAYWQSVLDAGAVDQGSFILAIIAGAKAVTGSTADAQYLETKAGIGAYYAVVNGLNNVSIANTVMQAFDGTVSSVSSAKQLIDDHAASIDTGLDAEFTMSLVGLAENALDWV